MLRFVTGIPGAGKTLFTIHKVLQYQEEEHQLALKTDPDAKKREVYYYGINQLTLPWHEFEDAKKWYELPQGAIIIIDEAQMVFPPMGNGAKRGEHYQKFQVHRHSGYDIFLITQDPFNVDFSIRSMTGYHWHLERNYGMEQAVLYEWQKCQRTTNTDFSQDKTAIKSTFKYPKEVYDYYKSAEVHTHRKTIPWRKILPIIAVMLLAFSIVGYSLWWLQTKRERMDETMARQSSEQQQSFGDGVVSSLGMDQTQQQPVNRTIFDNMANFAPTVDNLPMSAPIYSQFLQVRAVQKIDGCLRMSLTIDNTICICNDQRGNIIDVDALTCSTFIDKGFFDFTVSDNDFAQVNPQRPQTIVQPTRE